MNVKKWSMKKFDKENSLRDFNTNQTNSRNVINKKTTKLGQQVRRKMKVSNQNCLTTLNKLQKKSSQKNLRVNNDILNRPKPISHRYMPELNLKKVSSSMCDGSLSCRSTKSVRFQDYVDEERLKRKHSTSSILKHKSSMKKSMISDRGANSMKSSICSNILRDTQSSENASTNKLIRQKYQRLVQNLKKNNKKYSDQLYPPLKSCLFSNRNGTGANGISYKDVTWVRISEIYQGKSVTVWGKDQSQVQVSRGQFSNSNAVSNCFNSIKYNSFLLQKIFQDQKYNMYGIYLVKINQNNQWKYIIVDDYIPVLKGQNKKYQGAFMKTNNQTNSQIDIWPYLLQKAYAKYYSTYQALHSEQNQLDFLHEITGCPLEQIQVNEQNMQKIKEQLQNYDTILIGQQKKSEKCKKNKYYPIVPRRSDFVFYNTEVQTGSLKENCSQKEFIEKFQKINFAFLHKYFYTGFCTIKQTHTQTNTSIKNPLKKQQTEQHISIRYFKLQESSQCVLNLVQKDQKHYINNPSHTYCWVRMILTMKQGENSYQWIAGKYGNNKTLTIKSWLQAGEYEVILIPQWKSKPFDLNLVFYGNSVCQIQRKPYIGNENILTQSAMDLAQRNGRMKQLNQNICTYTFIDKQLGFIIENINNQRPNGHIRILRSVEGLQNNKTSSIRPFNKQFRKDNTIEVKIQSLQHFTVLLGVCGGVNRVFLEQFDFGS